MSISIFSLVAIVLYLAVAYACSRAARVAKIARRPETERRRWLAFTTFFGALAAFRASNLEEAIRSALREQLIVHGEYFERWSLQAPVAAAALVLLAAGIGALFLVHPAQRGRGRLAASIFVADLAVAAQVGLVMLRVISLHAVDALLYRGPHLNWLVDCGATFAVAYAALRYRNLLRAPRG